MLEAAEPEDHSVPAQLVAVLSELAEMYERGVVIPVCAWCGNHRIAEKWISPLEMSLAVPEGLTHGICPDCYETVAPSGPALHTTPMLRLSESQDA